MDDVLKLAEEALELVRGEVAHPMTTEAQNAYIDALAAIRAARAECGWRPIAEMEVVEDNGVTLGMWRNGAWVTTPEVWYRSWAVDHGFTHFHRPQLPTPPQEADYGK